MIKKTVLFLLCMTLFLSIPGCKKKLPTTPDIQPLLVLPTIAYFTANPGTIKLNESSTLSWSTTNATNVWIDRGVGPVAAIGTVEVSPRDSIIYTLSATNDDGSQTRTAQVLIYRWAVIEISTIPLSPPLHYSFQDSELTGDFIVVINETGGVGGRIDSIWIDSKRADNTSCWRNAFEGGTFSANGSLSRSVSLRVRCQAMNVVIIIKGVDMHGYTIDVEAWYGVTWGFASTGSMRFLKIVEGQNHHKLIK